MRILGLMVLGITGLSVSGCSQISSVFKKKPHYHTADGTAVYVNEATGLRTASQQTYGFADQSYEVDIYDSAFTHTQNLGYSAGTEYVYANDSVSEYAYGNYQVELFNSPVSYAVAPYSNPREAEFVKLNGESKAEDWRNCETLNRGYLWMSEFDFSLHPGFEVCMRNKGYVLTTEYGYSTQPSLSAKSAGLRGVYSYSSGYSLP
jgi:hypothetical protein